VSGGRRADDSYSEIDHLTPNQLVPGSPSCRRPLFASGGIASMSGQGRPLKPSRPFTPPGRRYLSLQVGSTADPDVRGVAEDLGLGK
jgi:hypothetical protein